MKHDEAPSHTGGLVAFIEGQEMRSVVYWLKTWTEAVSYTHLTLPTICSV